jgi:hypothetical protein
MKREALRELARDPRFIPGIYNYCDRWCERCPRSNRCLNYAMEKADDNGEPAARDRANEQFWQHLHQVFQETLAMVREDAQARGLNLDDPNLQAEIKAQARAERRRAARNLPLARAALAYTRAVDAWMKGAKPLLDAQAGEWETQARLAIGEPGVEASRLSDFIAVIRWYQHFIYVKLRRAIGSRASEELETDEEMKHYPKDSDGTAKVALLAMDRSLSAWAGVRAALGGEPEGVLDLLAQLAALRRATEKLFPEARAFVRPGFDEPAKTSSNPGRLKSRKPPA